MHRSEKEPDPVKAHDTTCTGKLVTEYVHHDAPVRHCPVCGAWVFPPVKVSA